MIVVDLGCAAHGEDRSIEPLIERFHPDVLYGFDPWPEQHDIDGTAGKTTVHLRRQAAWIYDGVIGYAENGLRSRVYEGQMGVDGQVAVPCFDLAEWLHTHAYGAGDVVVKMDVEGAEAPLIEHLIANDTDKWLTLLLVEWHDNRDFVEPYDRADLIARLRCPVEDW